MQLLNLVNGFNQDAFEITLLLYDDINSFYTVINPGVKVIRVKQPRYFKGSKSLFSIAWLMVHFFKEKYDFVVVFLFWHSLLVRLALLINPHPKVITSVRIDFRSYPLWRYPIESILSLRTQGIVVNSKSNLKLIQKWVLTPVICIPNGFDQKRFRFDGMRHHETLCIGTVGRQTKQKNQYQLIKALQQVKTPHIGWIIGDKSDETNRMVHEINLHKQDIILEDKRSDIHLCYRKMDVFVLTSFFEGFPNVLIEAMLSGCICIVTERVNSYDLIISDGINGLVYDGTDNGLVNALNRAIAILESESYDDFVKDSIKAAEKYSLESLISSWEKLCS